MDLLWVLLWSVVSDVAFSSSLGPCGVQQSHSSQSASSLLKSLRCYNDYKSHVECDWEKQENSAALQVWIQTESTRGMCVPTDASHSVGDGRARCRYDTQLFAVAISHTVFFLDNETKSLCSFNQNKFQDLVLHLRARPPVNLSRSEEGGGGWTLQWSSPYPPSSLVNLTYQLSYRMQTQNIWTTETVTSTSVKLERQTLLPGHLYEARVRTWAGLSQWSKWSPVVTWLTREDLVRAPSLDCVLDGLNLVTCSWEVSPELDHLITYQLTCRQNHTARRERCCRNLTVSAEPGGTAVSYSCSMTVADPRHLQLNLQPARNAKIFKAHQNIQPNPPQQVTVKEEDSNWTVEWTEPDKPNEPVKLCYQVVYYRMDDQSSLTWLNISAITRSVTILGSSLVPLQDYQVKVRSLVDPKSNSYKGIPSKWTEPVNFSPSEATSLLFHITYFFIGVVVAAVFLTVYCLVPSCQRKLMLWVESVPSPRKSKSLSEIKVRLTDMFGMVRDFRVFHLTMHFIFSSCVVLIQSVPSSTLMHNEKTSICKVRRLDSLSTCSSEVLLWESQVTQTKCVGPNSRSWGCGNLTPLVGKVNCSDTLSMSFICQASDSRSMLRNAQQEEKDYEPPTEEVPLSPFLGSSLYGKDYVCLPSRVMSRSTQELTAHSKCGGAEQSQRRPETKPRSVGLDGPCTPRDPATGSHPSAHTSGSFCSWPQAGASQTSDYCHLPAAK
ncbi:cytokine receptor common subunit beta isoform X2 [Nothobranchius furzeri]|uniref:cytokine receptor common subunit beta isoform X2 n=1 Tax=Nothobranchius furzeri TaxID=105023 RepID=UPI003904B645